MEKVIIVIIILLIIYNILDDIQNNDPFNFG